MPRRTIILLIASVLVVVLSSAASIAYVLRHPSAGTLVDQSELPTPKVNEEPKAEQVKDDARPARTTTEQCWRTYGRTGERPSSITNAGLGKPGRVLWKKPVGALVELPPSICDGVVYLNTARGITFAIDSDTGRTVWAQKTGTIFDSTPAIGEDLIVIGGVDGKIQALYRRTGKVRWKLQVGRSETSPVIDGDIVYAASHDGRVYAIYLKTGKVRWAYQSAGKINGSPVLWRDRVYVANYAGEVLALRTKDGSVAWRRTYVLDPFRTERFYSSTPIVGTSLYVSGVGGFVYALDARNGRDRWRSGVSGYAYATPAIARNTVFVGTYGKRLYAFNARTGGERWSLSLDGPVSGSALVVDDIVFISTMRHNRTIGYDVRTGRKVWSHEEGRYVPGIATDVRYYFSLRNTLYAIQGVRKPGARSFPPAVAG
jgi:outer membrane protein assembly factor BamB